MNHDLVLNLRDKVIRYAIDVLTVNTFIFIYSVFFIHRKKYQRKKRKKNKQTKKMGNVAEFRSLLIIE